MIDDLMRIEQVARDYNVPIGTLRYWRRAGTGPTSIRLGRRVVYRRRDVDEWLAAKFDRATSETSSR